MSNDAPLDQMRADLLGRKQVLAEELAEIEEGLKALDTFAAVYSRLTRDRHPIRFPQPLGPRGGHVAQAETPEKDAQEPAPKADRGSGLKSPEVPKTTFVLRAATDLGPERVFDAVMLTPQVNNRFQEEMGQALTQDQVSVSLRNLERTGKIQLLRKGGPRRPAIYANVDYRRPSARAVPEEVSPERIGAETEESEKGVEAV